MAVYPFLSFNGNCYDAMHFYQACFGGELRLRYLGDEPGLQNMPPGLAQLVVSAILESEHVRLFASDLVEEEGSFNGNRISLLFSTPQLDSLSACFNKLARKGKISGPLAGTLLAGEWSSLTDQYGVQWIFSCP